MDADIFQEMFPQEFVAKFAEQAVRLDGRQFKQARRVILEYIDGVINYQYADCFISIKYKTTVQEVRDLNNLIKINISFNHVDDVNYVDKQRIDSYYVSKLTQILNLLIVDKQQLVVSQNSGIIKAFVLEFNVRVSTSDGSLLSHLISALSFGLGQSIYFNKQVKLQVNDIESYLQLREVKAQTFLQFKNNLFIDPNEVESSSGSVVTIIFYQDDQKYEIIKDDGKPFDNISQCFDQF